jgi:hypothetical protein
MKHQIMPYAMVPRRLFIVRDGFKFGDAFIDRKFLLANGYAQCFSREGERG